MRPIFLCLCICFSVVLHSQLKTDEANPRYLEDQFYAGISYNFILNKPDDVNQRNFSYGLQGGFIKDIPLNSDRNFGIGIGLGLGVYNYYTNIRAIDSVSSIGYDLVDGIGDFKRSKIESYLIEVPFEFRWRNSDATAYNFWRIYTGVKFGYALNSRSKYVEISQKGAFTNNDVRNFQYGLTLNFGYHNFNIHAYYSLTNLFDDGVTLNGINNEMSTLRIGLIFYIL